MDARRWVGRSLESPTLRCLKETLQWRWVREAEVAVYSLEVGHVKSGSVRCYGLRFFCIFLQGKILHMYHILYIFNRFANFEIRRFIASLPGVKLKQQRLQGGKASEHCGWILWSRLGWQRSRSEVKTCSETRKCTLQVLLVDCFVG